MATIREHVERARQRARTGVADIGGRIFEAVAPEVKHATREVGDRDLLRSNVRAAAGSTVASFIRDRATQARRQGNYGLHLALQLAHKYVSGYQERTAAEQRLFENTARVRRGDVHMMNHADLRAVADHADKYGGAGLHDKEHLRTTAENELARRESVRTREKERKESERSARSHQQHMAQRTETHQQRLGHIRERAQVKVQAKQEAKAGARTPGPFIGHTPKAAQTPKPGARTVQGAAGFQPHRVVRAPAGPIQTGKKGGKFILLKGGGKQYVGASGRPTRKPPRR